MSTQSSNGYVTACGLQHAERERGHILELIFGRQPHTTSRRGGNQLRPRRFIHLRAGGSNKLAATCRALMQRGTQSTVLSRLASYLEAQSQSITDQWLLAVRRDSQIDSADR